MKALLASMLIVMMPVGTASSEEPFACNIGALTKSERSTHHKLSRTLRAEVQEQKELPYGYAFRLPPAMLVKTAQWVSFERRCCPFFTFELQIERDGGPLWMRVTGTEGVKEFIREEFGLDS